ncbi:MAG: glycosyltransferase family 2 protein [Bacteroidetes bacterium]|nr:glycosyltransferase family 2 protein [Bacteroidota bacterium]
MNKPLISLVTVCFNAENLIADTLQSAINQTYKNIELVIVDGNSMDNTLNVVKRFENHIGTLISESDNGIYDAMNKGIKAAKGDWVYFLNAGDSLINNHILDDVFNQELPSDCLFIYGKVQTLNEPTGVDYLAGNKVTFSDFYSKYPICHQATFTHKEAFKTFGFYDTNYKLAADTEWFARLFKYNSNQTLFINKTIAHYDIQGATYVKRMQGYREYLSFGFKHFPFFVSVKNVLFYPLLWLKVKLIRLLSNHPVFVAYRKIKFKSSQV